MFVFNITTKVDHAISEEWLQWQKKIHIPEIMATGLFYDHRLYQLLEHDDAEGKTFVSQFLTNSKINYNEYLQQFAPQLQKKSLEKWGGQVIAFPSLLENLK